MRKTTRAVTLMISQIESVWVTGARAVTAGLTSAPLTHTHARGLLPLFTCFWEGEALWTEDTYRSTSALLLLMFKSVSFNRWAASVIAVGSTLDHVMAQLPFPSSSSSGVLWQTTVNVAFPPPTGLECGAAAQNCRNGRVYTIDCKKDMYSAYER